MDIRLMFSSEFSSLIGNILVFILVISHSSPKSYHNDIIDGFGSFKGMVLRGVYNVSE
jgi:hypothetical protein